MVVAVFEIKYANPVRFMLNSYQRLHLSLDSGTLRSMMPYSLIADLFELFVEESDPPLTIFQPLLCKMLLFFYD